VIQLRASEESDILASFIQLRKSKEWPLRQFYFSEEHQNLVICQDLRSSNFTLVRKPIAGTQFHYCPQKLSNWMPTIIN
jgi:hypothetical protein